MNFFAYGTLMIPEVFIAVCGAMFPCREATLADFARFRLKGRTYPGLVPRHGCMTAGKVYLDLSEAHLERLDRFEGEWYLRQAVTVQADESQLGAEAYVIAPRFRRHLSDRRWSLSHFRKHHLEGFLAGYRGFSQDV